MQLRIIAISFVFLLISLTGCVVSDEPRNIQNRNLSEVLDLNIPDETVQMTKLLDFFSETLGNFAPERSEMSVLAEEEYKGSCYAVVATYTDPPLLYLLQYETDSNGTVDILRFISGDYASSAGITPNYVCWPDAAIFWSDIKSTRLAKDENGDWSKRIPNDFTSIRFVMKSGTKVDFNVECPGILLLPFELKEAPLSCELFNAQGETGISFSLEEVNSA